MVLFWLLQLSVPFSFLMLVQYLRLLLLDGPTLSYYSWVWFALRFGRWVMQFNSTILMLLLWWRGLKLCNHWLSVCWIYGLGSLWFRVDNFWNLFAVQSCLAVVVRSVFILCKAYFSLIIFFSHLLSIKLFYLRDARICHTWSKCLWNFLHRPPELGARSVRPSSCSGFGWWLDCSYEIFPIHAYFVFIELCYLWPWACGPAVAVLFMALCLVDQQVLLRMTIIYRFGFEEPKFTIYSSGTGMQRCHVLKSFF